MTNECDEKSLRNLKAKEIFYQVRGNEGERAERKRERERVGRREKRQRARERERERRGRGKFSIYYIYTTKNIFQSDNFLI